MDAGRLRLYLVADPDHVEGDLARVVASAIDGGVTCVQLRVKSRPDRVFQQLGHEIAAVCRNHGAMFLVNDRLDIALAVGADGVHLGVDDLSVESARRVGGDRFVIGYSPETDDQAGLAGLLGASYLGVGPVFGTTSKHDAGEAIGLDTLRRRVALSGLPTVGIGGITAANARQTLSVGACGVAVMSAILRSNEPASAANALILAMREASG